MECHWAGYQLLSKVSNGLHIHRGGLRLNSFQKILLEMVYECVFSLSYIWVDLCLLSSYKLLESRNFCLTHLCVLSPSPLQCLVICFASTKYSINICRFRACVAWDWEVKERIFFLESVCPTIATKCLFNSYSSHQTAMKWDDIRERKGSRK